MTWEIRRAGNAFAGFAEEWDRLNRTLYEGHPLFDSRFIGALLGHFGSGKEMLCVHRTDNHVDGALILCPRGYGRWTLFLPAQAQAGALLVGNARCLETLMPTLPGKAWTIDLLAIDPDFEPEWNGLDLPRTMVRHDLTMAVGTQGEFDSYWQARPNKLRTNLRRYQRKSGDHITRLQVTDDAEEISVAVNRYAELESAGWKAKTGTAISPDNPQGSFYGQVLRQFAASGQAKVIELWFDDKLAASRLVICHRGMWIMLKTTYDESLSAMAPGRQLLHEALRLAFVDIPSAVVEFYTNATRDQAEWATNLRYTCHHQLYRNLAVANLHGVVRALKRRLSGGDGTAPVHGFEPTSITAYSSPGAIPASVRSLYDAATCREVELSLDWFANLQSAVFADDNSARYYCADLNNSPRTLLPIHVTRGNGLRLPQIESLSNFYTSLYSPFVAPSANATDLSRLLVAVTTEFSESNVMNFHPMAPDSRSYDAMVVALRSIGWIPFRYFCFGNWFLKVDRAWQAYLEQRDGALRNTIKRKGKRFLAAGGTFEIIAGPANIEPAIDEFNALYRQRWKKAEPFPAFVPGLIRWLAADGKLRLGIARIGDAPVAAQLWIVNHGKASIYKLAYDEEYASYAPGTLLTAHLLEHVINRDAVTEVDYLIGDDRYKQSWMSHRRERWGIVAYNAGSFAGLSLLLLEVAGRAIRKLLKHPREQRPSRP